MYHFKFILFVTGKGEQQHLPKMFKSLSKSKICSFTVGEFVGQLRPITSPKRIPRMVGTGQQLPNGDFERIGAPARRYIQEDPCHLLMLIDDLEGISEDEAMATFNRYRKALDSGLGNDKRRASVHFLVNMLEAYFFADSNALNSALNLEPPVGPHDGDVEAIQHPKNKLKRIFPAYRETEHPGLILDLLDLDVVLSNPNHCASLRTCIKWIVDQIKTYPNQTYFDELNFERRFHLTTDKLYDVTANQ